MVTTFYALSSALNEGVINILTLDTEQMPGITFLPIEPIFR